MVWKKFGCSRRYCIKTPCTTSWGMEVAPMGSFSSSLGRMSLGAAGFWLGGGLFATVTGLFAVLLGSLVVMLLLGTTGEDDELRGCADAEPASWVEGSEENEKNHQLRFELRK